MAEKRKPISKKKRFEVFKRDNFTCQYCGRMAPDVILEVDHIKPVAEGGNNGMLNLITSCRDCNRGKGKTKLSDNAEIKKQQNELLELASKREQMEMLLAWRNELKNEKNRQVEFIADYIVELTGNYLTDNEKRKVRSLINRFSFAEVCDAVDISFSMYYNESDVSWYEAFHKIGGICYNKRKQRDGDI